MKDPARRLGNVLTQHDLRGIGFVLNVSPRPKAGKLRFPTTILPRDARLNESPRPKAGKYRLHPPEAAPNRPQ